MHADDSVAVTPVHQWDGNFRGTPASFTMTAVTGHGSCTAISDGTNTSLQH